jgi:predicted transcriptional regulator
MTKLQQALEKIAALPQAAQDDIAEQLLRQVKRVQRLRAEILKGLESLDRGRYTELDAQEIIKQARAAYMADR